MFCAASQVQLDVEKEAVVEVLNTFNKLEPIKAVLFANSLWQETPELLINRDRFWKYSLHGINPHNLDMYDTELRSVDEILEYIKSESIYCIERDGKYINFAPTPLKKYFSSDKIHGEYFAYGKYYEIDFEPKIDDLEYLRSFKFQDLTYRGTVEFRSVCEQPVSEIMGAAAFHAGLIEYVHELNDLLESDNVIYGHGYSPTELRALFSRRELPDFVDRSKLSELIDSVLNLAEKGLKKRSFGEEKFLQPLYHRARNLYSPARQIIDGLDSGVPIEYYINEFANLN
jgi:gamma-glutamylcysteine synthetase